MRTYWPVLLVAICLGAAACASLRGAARDLRSGFAGTHAPSRPPFDGTLKVVSYNIRFAKQIGLAIEDLGELEDLRKADIILLQEMDEAGTAQVARALAYNYVYYAASTHGRHNRLFGNAILSRWPIEDQERIPLPHKSPWNGQQRIAVRAVVTIPWTRSASGVRPPVEHGYGCVASPGLDAARPSDLEILVYSVHTETIWLSARKRADQVLAVVDSIGEAYPYVVVGGDFNTATSGAVTDLVRRFEVAGLTRASSGASPTLRFGFLSWTLDHIFVRGMPVLAAGTAGDAAASDHLPIWAELDLSNSSPPASPAPRYVGAQRPGT
ncbi:MAG: endonuclease/exonuclease/phosphatase family protein [Anaerolineae bacterium]